MLIARGHQALGGGSLSWTVAFGRALWVKIIQHEGLALDTRFVPAAPDPPKAHVCLVLLLQGSWRSHGARDEIFVGPSALALSLEHLYGADGRRPLTYVISGNPCTLIEVYLAGTHALPWPPRPCRVDLDAAAWDAVRRTLSATGADDASLIAALGELFRRLSACEIVTEECTTLVTSLPPKPLVQLWKVLLPIVERFSLAATVDDVVEPGGLSSGQVERIFQRFVSYFSLVGPGMRSLTHHVRLKTAVLFLSAEGATVAEVAAFTGYGSAETMARAFRIAGLPSPSVVRGQLREHFL